MTTPHDVITNPGVPYLYRVFDLMTFLNTRRGGLTRDDLSSQVDLYLLLRQVQPSRAGRRTRANSMKLFVKSRVFQGRFVLSSHTNAGKQT